MTTPAKYLTALMVSAALGSAASATTPEECVAGAAKDYHAGMTYLGHKPTMIGTAVAFSVPKTLALPSFAENGLVPVFKKSSSGVLVFNTEMSSLYFYDRPLSSVLKDGEGFTEKNFDAIGLLASTQDNQDEPVRPDSAKSMDLTLQLLKFVNTVRDCLKPR